jgi:hypothetical protein
VPLVRGSKVFVNLGFAFAACTKAIETEMVERRSADLEKLVAHRSGRLSDV